MVITQTPLRVSLLGGGTDFPEFYEKHGGAVLTLGINRYVYVIVKDRFDPAIHINYSRKESVYRVKDVQHDLIREAMVKTNVQASVEITALSDVPSEGTGLGSSSSITVGVLNALHTFQGRQTPAEKLSDEACDIERIVLARPIGVQDQMIAAHGGMKFIEFHKGGSSHTRDLPISLEEKRDFCSRLLMYYTGQTRSAGSILEEQKREIPIHTNDLKDLTKLAYEGQEALSCGEFDKVGELLHKNWEIKKKLAGGITSPNIDAMYNLAIDSGALGGKIGGAGGGGFLLLYCPLKNQDELRDAFLDYQELPINLARDGSKVIFNIHD